MTAPKSYNLTQDDLDTIMRNEHLVIAAMRHATDKHYAAIMSELNMFDALSPLDRVRHAVVFSVISPKCPIKNNCAVTPHMVKLIMDGGNEDEIRALLLEFGIGLQNVKAQRLAANAEFLRTMTSADVTRELLSKLAGISLKTSSMAIVLYDANAEHYTLDTHMLRGLRLTVGLDAQQGTHAAPDAKYIKLEKWLVKLAKEHCADAPIFLTQWALWNEWGFGGEHQVHLDIFGITH